MAASLAREPFVDEMDQVVPSAELQWLAEPRYPNAGCTPTHVRGLYAERLQA